MKTGFVLSMVLSERLDVQGKMDKHYYVQFRVTQELQVNTKLLMECCLGALKPSQDGEGEWSRVG